jgi:hypothetical protein
MCNIISYRQGIINVILIVTSLRTGTPRDYCSILVRVKIFSHLIQTDRRRQIGRDVTLSIYLRVLPRLRMCARIKRPSFIPLCPAKNELYFLTLKANYNPYFTCQKIQIYWFLRSNSAPINKLVNYIMNYVITQTRDIYLQHFLMWWIFYELKEIFFSFILIWKALKKLDYKLELNRIGWNVAQLKVKVSLCTSLRPMRSWQ